MMTLNSLAILQAVESHALSLGRFERVNRHEPKNKPGLGLSLAIWVQSVGPMARMSGLAATSARVELSARVYTSMLSEPQDAIDPNITAAVDALINAYSGDFTLGNLVAYVDLLGQFGDGLSARAGYLEQDHKMYRVMTITLPLVVNDVWVQSA